MEKEKIYIIKVYSYLTKQTEILATAYKEETKAMLYCEEQLNEEEREYNRKAKNRGLMTKYEYTSKNYSYEIGEIDLI